MHPIIVVAVALCAAVVAWAIGNDYYLRILFMMSVYYLCAAGMNVLVLRHSDYDSLAGWSRVAAGLG